MTKTRTVAFYGNSLLISSLGATLISQEDLRVEYIETGETESAEKLQDLRPDVVLFDLTAAKPDFMLSLFSTQPQTRLIGVDPDGRRLLVLSGRAFRGLAVSDLLGVILDLPVSPEDRGSGS